MKSMTKRLYNLFHNHQTQWPPYSILIIPVGLYKAATVCELIEWALVYHGKIYIAYTCTCTVDKYMYVGTDHNIQCSGQLLSWGESGCIRLYCSECMKLKDIVCRRWWYGVDLTWFQYDRLKRRNEELTERADTAEFQVGTISQEYRKLLQQKEVSLNESIFSHTAHMQQYNRTQYR